MRGYGIILKLEQNIRNNDNKTGEIFMELMIQILLLVAGFLLLVKGADWFVEGAASIADKFGFHRSSSA